jgi:DNA-directed RNA polymerase sigma subunit (sigma70/sigma32)
MNHNLGQVAGPKALVTVYDFTSASKAKALVNAEMALIKTQGISFVDSLAKLSKQKRYQSIICCALSRNDRIDEDIVSQALLLLQEASIKYFKKDRTINFKQFAITCIHESIKAYKSKQNHTNGSDLNELIHTAIRAVKNCNKRQVENLTYHEAKHLADHFNLDKTKGVKRIFELETIQFGNLSDWRVNEEGEEYYIFDDQKNDIDASNYNPPSSVEDKIIEKQHLNILANQSRLFLSSCNNKESLIFKKRINCKEKITLDELSKVLNVSIQRINAIEKILYEKFVNFFKSNIEKEKIADKG